MNRMASMCPNCDYVIAGSFTNCIRCGRKGMTSYKSFNDPELRARIRKAEGHIEGATPLVSLAVVAVLSLLLALVMSVAVDAKTSPLTGISVKLASLIH